MLPQPYHITTFQAAVAEVVALGLILHRAKGKQASLVRFLVGLLAYGAERRSYMTSCELPHLEGTASRLTKAARRFPKSRPPDPAELRAFLGRPSCYLYE